MVAMGAALRGTGNFKPGMVVQTATVILNMILAPFLIFGWVTPSPARRRRRGARHVRSRSRSGTVWLALYFLPTDAYLKFVPVRLEAATSALWRRLLKIGLPAGAEFALMAVYLFIVYVISRPFGAAAQAGFGIGMRIDPGGLHAGGGARLRGRAGGGAELRRAQAAARARHVPDGCSDGRVARWCSSPSAVTSRRPP